MLFMIKMHIFSPTQKSLHLSINPKSNNQLHPLSFLSLQLSTHPMAKLHNSRLQYKMILTHYWKVNKRPKSKHKSNPWLSTMKSVKITSFLLFPYSTMSVINNFITFSVISAIYRTLNRPIMKPTSNSEAINSLQSPKNTSMEPLC